MRLLAMAQERVYRGDGHHGSRRRNAGAARTAAFENRPGAAWRRPGILHTTSRPVDGHAPDMRSTGICSGSTPRATATEGGRIKAADFAKIYRDSGYYDALFKSMVAYDFARMGLPVVRRANAEIGPGRAAIR